MKEYIKQINKIEDDLSKNSLDKYNLLIILNEIKILLNLLNNDSIGKDNKEIINKDIKYIETKLEDYKFNKQREQLSSQINSTKKILDDLKFLLENKVENTMNNTKVFIVHGHDDLAKVEVARFIEKLGLEAIILHEQNDSGQTIIEKLEKNTDVGFAVILYTACDVGRHKDDNDLKNRARQNVIFEHGYLIAKIGRENVLALVKGDVEKPSDISGVVYTEMDSSGAWKNKLARELRSSNFDVDMNKI